MWNQFRCSKDINLQKPTRLISSSYLKDHYGGRILQASVCFVFIIGTCHVCPIMLVNWWQRRRVRMQHLARPRLSCLWCIDDIFPRKRIGFLITSKFNSKIYTKAAPQTTNRTTFASTKNNRLTVTTKIGWCISWVFASGGGFLKASDFLIIW